MEIEFRLRNGPCRQRYVAGYFKLSKIDVEIKIDWLVILTELFTWIGIQKSPKGAGRGEGGNNTTATRSRKGRARLVLRRAGGRPSRGITCR